MDARYPPERPAQRPSANHVGEEREMRKIMLIAAALVAGAVGLSQTAAAQDVKPKAAAEEMTVTGVVTKADQHKREITIGDKSFVLSNEAFPQVGAKVTAFYENRGGKNVVTRIGQAQ
jgi:Ni/Co efflux regulator RcnB